MTSTTSYLEGARIVKPNPNALERLSQRVARARRNGTVIKLRRFREGFAADMDVGDWTMFQGPFVLFLADLCDSLSLTDQERAEVLGPDGERVLAAFLNARFAVVEKDDQ